MNYPGQSRVIVAIAAIESNFSRRRRILTKLITFLLKQANLKKLLKYVQNEP